MNRLSATLLSLALWCSPAQSQEVRTVERVDLGRYTGLWHEIAKIPNRFQRHCARGTTATYRLREDGRIEVINRCHEADGDLDEARGVARVVDPETNARLQVSFVSFLGWRPFWGDYWILGLDEDYRWVVVGTPDRKYGWILARETSLDAPSMDAVALVLERNGYSLDSFEFGEP